MNFKTIFAFLVAAAVSCATVYAEDSNGGGGSFTYDDFIEVTTNAYCLVREGTLYGYTSSLSTSVAPTTSDITAIAPGCFAGNTTITTVNLSSTGITEIPSDCFAGCTALSSVTLPSTCTAIGANAFAGCTKLTSVPGSATSLGAYAFAGSGVTSVDLDGVTPAEGTFAGCASLASASNLPSELPDALFRGDAALATADVSGVTSFGEASLSGCDALSGFTLSDDDSLGLGDYAIAAGTATVTTTLTNSSVPDYDETVFLGREVSYTPSSGVVVRVEAADLVTWLQNVASAGNVTNGVTVTQPTTYSTADLKSWLADSSNLSAIVAYCYDGEATDALEVLTVSGSTFSFTESTASGKSVTVTPVGGEELDVDAFDEVTFDEGTYAPGTDEYFMQLRFSVDW